MNNVNVNSSAMNFHSEVAASRFLTLLSPDVNKADECFRRLRSRLTAFFRHRSACDPELLADEVIFRVWRRLGGSVDIRNGLLAYCYGVADRVLREQARVQGTVQLSDASDSSTRSVRDLYPIEKSVLLSECLAVVGAEERDLLVAYHNSDRVALAHRHALTGNSLRLRVFRARRKVVGSARRAGLTAG